MNTLATSFLLDAKSEGLPRDKSTRTAMHDDLINISRQGLFGKEGQGSGCLVIVRMTTLALRWLSSRDENSTVTAD